MTTLAQYILGATLVLLVWMTGGLIVWTLGALALRRHVRIDVARERED